MLEIHQFPCLSDNYGYLIHDSESAATAAIDTPDAEEITRQAAAKGWRISDVWNTHWHPDHAGGNAALKAQGASVTGPAEVERIGAAPDRIVQEGDVVMLGRSRARVLDVGGHTLGHIAYVFDDEDAAFVGDAIFTLGCGRLFEGTPQQMWESLGKLAALPDATKLYCAHEYTLANARFAASVDSENSALKARIRNIESLRAQNRPTVPTSVAEEKATNPFLRAPALLPGRAPWQAFAEIRAQKDAFK